MEFWRKSEQLLPATCMAITLALLNPGKESANDARPHYPKPNPIPVLEVPTSALVNEHPNKDQIIIK
jgi:hypothetical protein